MPNFRPGANLHWPDEGMSRLDSVQRLMGKHPMKLKLKGTSANPAAARDLGPRSRLRSTTTSASLVNPQDARSRRGRSRSRCWSCSWRVTTISGSGITGAEEPLRVAREPDRQEAPDEWAWNWV